MTLCLFASDLHGRVDRYEKLFAAIETRRPAAVFLGGDLLPHVHLTLAATDDDFIAGFLASHFELLRTKMKQDYPRIFAILGNDDARIEEDTCRALEARGLWSYIHDRRVEFAGHDIYGYAYVPPTPFGLKDWERYDVSRFVPHGCVSPEEGFRSVEVELEKIRYATIAEDLQRMAGERPQRGALWLIHTPPHETNLDRAALDGKSIDGVPLDVHVGSIAVRRFIEAAQPLVTLHGHIHESARITGNWRGEIGGTQMFNASHDGPELALVRFDLERPQDAERDLL